MIILEVNKVNKNFGYGTLFENLSFSLNEGESISIVGPNGCGKSTLLKMIIGLTKIDGGSINIKKGVKVAYLDQTGSSIEDERSVYEILKDAFAELNTIQKKINDLQEKLSSEEIANILGKDKNDTIVDLVNEKYFLSKNLDTYLEYHEEEAELSLSDVVAVVNVHAYQNWYETILDSDPSLNERVNVNKFYALSSDYTPENLKNISLDYSYGNEGDNKLVVTLDKRIPYFKLLMGFPLFFPQNQKVVEANGSKYGTSSKTTAFNGPFVQKGWTGSNLSWKLVKNKNYWDKKNVKLDAINYSVQKTPSTAYNLYQSNKLDATILDSQQTKNLKHQKGYTLRDTAATFYLQFNQKKKIFQNADLRRAISMSINRKALGSALGGANTPATSLTSKGVVNHDGKDWSEVVGDKKNAAYNPTEAKKLYKKALKELGVKNVSVTILSDDTDSGQKTTETLQSQLEENLKGMKVSVANVPFKTRLNRSTSGNFDVVVSGWSADFADPISFVDLFTSKNAQNNGKWSNSQYDKLIADSKTTADTTKRWDDLEKAEKILLSDEGIAPLYYKTEAWLVRPDIKGIVYNGAGLNYNFKNTYVAN